MGIEKVRSLSVEELKSIIENTRSKSEALKKIGTSRKNSHALNYLNKLIVEYGIDTSHHTNGVPLSTRYSKDIVQQSVDESLCWTDLMSKLGIRFVGSNIKSVQRLVEYYNIDTAHFDPIKAAIKNRTKSFSIPDDLVFIENSTVHRSGVKSRLIKRQLIEYKCDKCGNDGQWNGQVLVLQLEHKNGVNNDHRLENLCWLCPNCHSQTSTFDGRNLIKK